jgi:Ankyrin repeat
MFTRFLVDNGADPYLLYPNSPYIHLFQATTTKLSATALRYLFSADVILFLLEIGSYPNQCNRNGVTALTLAVREGRDDSVYELLRYGANPLMHQGLD